MWTHKSSPNPQGHITMGLAFQRTVWARLAHTDTLEHTHSRMDTHVHTLCKWKAEEVEAGPCALRLSLGH